MKKRRISLQPVPLQIVWAIVLCLALALILVESRAVSVRAATLDAQAPQVAPPDQLYLPHLSASGDASPAPTAQPTPVPTEEVPDEPPGEPPDVPPDVPPDEPTPVPTPSPPTGDSTGVLANAGLFHGLNGVKLGALPASLGAPVTVTLTITDAPPEAMPPGVISHGNYYHLSADRDLVTTLQDPLLVGFPVPPGADVAHLALGVLDYQEPFVKEGDLAWYFLDGLYDAEQGLFLTTLSFLNAAGNVFVLAEHFSFESPANGSEVQRASTRVGTFTVACRNFEEPEDCTPDVEEEVATYLDQIYHRMTDVFDFPELPRLQNPRGRIILKEDENSLSYVSGFSATIVPKTYFRCERAAGLYRPNAGRLYLCYDPEEGITSFTVHVLIHEYFHSVQYSYPEVYAPDAEDPPPSPDAWVIEGMATMAEGAYFLDDAVVRSTEGLSLFNVNHSLVASTWEDADLDEYYAQDFWAYVGQRYSLNLGYLDWILNVYGATTERVAEGLEYTYGIPFGELYWGFVKNQIFENTYDLGDNLGRTCRYTDPAHEGLPIGWPYHPSDYLGYPQDDLYDSVEPMRAKVIELGFPGNETRAIMEVRLRLCDGLSGDNEFNCRVRHQQSLHSKIYAEAETDCHLDPTVIEGERTLVLDQPGRRYFVVLANATFDEVHEFYVLLEPQYFQ